MINKNELKTILAKENIVPEKEIVKVAVAAQMAGKSLEAYLIDKKIITEDKLYASAAKHFNLPIIDLSKQKIDKKMFEQIPEAIATIHNLIILESDQKSIQIATGNPGNLEIFEFLNKKLNKKITLNIATPTQIKEKLKELQKNWKSELPSEKDNKNKDAEHGDSSLPQASWTAEKIVTKIIEYAIKQGASDIHLEAGEKDVIVRYRIDGILHDSMVLPKETHANIVARIKILANLKIDEHRLPQDGRIKMSGEGYKTSIRVSTMPAIEGEKIVMRLLNEKSEALTLEQLGFQPRSLALIKANIKKPHGLILATGPTGSGKTTTLYSVLHILNNPQVNISTIEDPIEYRMPRVNQAQVNTKVGFTFASGLRALLRQDPDIIMVGEIRDQETAEIAINAALTGHLVISTLHTNDAPSALFRLHDMGVPSFLIAATTNLIIAQRLARKICPNCIQSYNLDKATIAELDQIISLPRLLASLKKEKMIATDTENLDSILFYRGRGCAQCDQTGYKGRIGIYETLEMNDGLAALVNRQAGLAEIKQEAEKQGMMSMAEDGFIKAKNGITTLEEVLRVARE